MYSLTHNRIRFKFPFTLVKCFLNGENVTLKLNSLNILCELWLVSIHPAPLRAGLDDLALLLYLEKCSSLTYRQSKSSLTKTTSSPINSDLVFTNSQNRTKIKLTFNSISQSVYSAFSFSMCVRGCFTSISKYYKKKLKQNFSTKLQKLWPNAGRQYMSCNSFINILLTDPVVRGVSHLVSNHIPLISWLEKPVSCL